jgi:hypothetical protein
MNIKMMVPPKKIVWKSFSSTLDILVWLIIFDSLNFKDIKTVGIIIGIFLWTFIDYYVGLKLEDKKKEI